MTICSKLWNMKSLFRKLHVSSASGDTHSFRRPAQFLSNCLLFMEFCAHSAWRVITLYPQVHIGQSKPTPTSMPSGMLSTLKQPSRPKVWMRSPLSTLWPSAARTETGYYLCLPEKDQKGTCISTEVSLAQPPGDGDLEPVENTCSVWCFGSESLREGAVGTDEDSLVEIICSRANQELQEINKSLQGNVQGWSGEGHYFRHIWWLPQADGCPRKG